MGFSRSHNNELNSAERGRAGADTPMSIQDFDVLISIQDFDASLSIQDDDMKYQFKTLTCRCRFGTMQGD